MAMGRAARPGMLQSAGMVTRHSRASGLGAKAMELAVAVTLLTLLAPQDKVLCRGGGGHEALESVLAGCCDGAEPDAGCGSPLMAAPGTTAGGEECTDLAVPLRSLCVRPQPVPAGGLLPAARLDTCGRGSVRSMAVLAAPPVPTPTLACVQATTLLI